MLGDFYVAFLKKSSAKNFTKGKVFAHIVRSAVVLIKFDASGRPNASPTMKNDNATVGEGSPLPFFYK